MGTGKSITLCKKIPDHLKYYLFYTAFTVLNTIIYATGHGAGFVLSAFLPGFLLLSAAGSGTRAVKVLLTVCSVLLTAYTVVSLVLARKHRKYLPLCMIAVCADLFALVISFIVNIFISGTVGMLGYVAGIIIRSLLAFSVWREKNRL